MKTAAFASALFAITAMAPANAAFTIQNTNGADGFVTVIDPQNFTVFGGDNGAPGSLDPTDTSSLTTYAGLSSTVQSVRFSWNYATDDLPELNLDPAGYFVNSVFFQLSPIDLPDDGMASGMETVDLALGDVFGFYVSSLDTQGGRGSLTISLVSAVPEPGTWAMMIVGFGMVGGALRYRRRSTKVTFATA